MYTKSTIQARENLISANTECRFPLAAGDRGFPERAAQQSFKIWSDLKIGLFGVFPSSDENSPMIMPRIHRFVRGRGKRRSRRTAGLTGICSPNRMYPNRNFERLNAWRNQVRWRLAVTMQHVNTVDSRRYGKVEEKSTPTGERTVLFLLNSVRSWVEGSFPVSPHPGQV